MSMKEDGRLQGSRTRTSTLATIQQACLTTHCNTHCVFLGKGGIITVAMVAERHGAVRANPAECAAAVAGFLPRQECFKVPSTKVSSKPSGEGQAFKISEAPQKTAQKADHKTTNHIHLLSLLDLAHTQIHTFTSTYAHIHSTQPFHRNMHTERRWPRLYNTIQGKTAQESLGV